MVKVQMKVSVVVRDPRGRITFERTKACRSYVRAMMDILHAAMSYGSTLLVPDTGNTPRTITAHVNNFRADGGAGVTTHGIRVGTSTQAVAITDYALISPIAEGAGAGQLQHAATTFVTPVTVGSTRRFTISRTLTNVSGGSITVQEAAIYCMGSATPYYFCVERSLLSFTIPNGSSATVTYTISVTV